MTYSKILVIFGAFLLTYGVLGDQYETSVDKFTGHFYKEATEQNTKKNVIVSGLSADFLFSMVATGAEGQTKQEIEKALFINNIESATPSIKIVLDTLYTRKLEGVTLNIANKFYVASDLTVAPTYRSRVRDIFRSDVEAVNFGDSIGTANLINKWVLDHTNNQIKDLIDSKDIDSLTVGVLVNAIYFKGDWKKKFPKDKTKPEQFHLEDGSKVTLDMMAQRSHFQYKESVELDAKILKLPYKSEEFSMFIILPNSNDGLKALEGKLINGINEHITDLYTADVNIKIPKFNAETTTDIKAAMVKLGVERVFGRTAELNRIFGKNVGAYVSNAIQKAFIKVDEEGAEAGAASAAIIRTKSARVYKSVEFIADHPFYFAIVKSGSKGPITLFSGNKRY